MIFLTKRHKGELYAISSGICYGLVGFFGMSLIQSGLSVSNMLFWRFLISALIVFIIIPIKHKFILQPYLDNLRMLFYGIFFHGTSTVAYFISSKYLGTGMAMVILFTYPVFVILINLVLYKTILNRIYYLIFFILIGGIICLVDLHKFTFDFIGICIGILSAIFYACYILASKKHTNSPVVSTFMVSVGSLLTALIVSGIDSSLYIPGKLSIWLNILGMAFICTALPILLLLRGLRYISSEKASMLSILEPVFVVISGVCLLHEKINNLQLVGIIVILLGALLTLICDRSSVTHS